MENIDHQPDIPHSSAIGREMLVAYRQMLVILFLVTFVVVVILVVTALILDTENKEAPIFIGVVLAGILGALFSTLTRLYNVRDLPKVLLHPELRKLRSKYLLYYSLVPLLIGFIASAFIYFATMSGIIDGIFFPEFKCAADDCDSFSGLFKYAPDTVVDYAKAMVIGFISGFSERLVKNVLGRVESSSK